jgi:hypothetical protein
VATFDRALAAFRGRDVTCPLASSYGTQLPNQTSGEDEVTFASVSPRWRLPGQVGLRVRNSVYLPAVPPCGA